MGYVAKKIRKQEDGSIYWQVVFENRRKDRPKDVARETPIHRNKLFTIGVNPNEDSFEQVREKCQQLNNKDRLQRLDERGTLVQSIFLPMADVTEFESKILSRRFARDEDSLKHRRLLSHWSY